MRDVEAFVDSLNTEYESLHTLKEDAFWTSFMNLAENADQASRQQVETEVRLKEWLADPNRLRSVRDRLEEAGKGLAEGVEQPDWLVALEGWERTLSAHVIDHQEARVASTKITELEASMGRARESMPLGYQLPGKAAVRCSSIKLGNILRAETDESLRRAAWQGLRSIETHVLANGFLDIVRERNRLAQLQGEDDFYEWSVKATEGMTKAEIFALLDEFESKTRPAAQAALAAVSRQNGGGEVKPWNSIYAMSGDLTREADPFFPFESSLRRWGESFYRMGIRYRKASLVLDLLDRRGKHENGFMHGPVPAWRRHGEFRPARIHFTANAIPGQIGAGQRSVETFLHEGGHAAHFANIDMPSPCFSQEFAPTSVAFSEIQSIFMDNLVQDADWLTRYARTVDGEPMPMELIERRIQMEQPFTAWNYRAWLVVPYFERALYELPDEQLTVENVLKIAREIEARITLLPEGSPRPVLAIPHLLTSDSSAYYHGYLLAQMGVDQTRDWFRANGEWITDNPRVGPQLAAGYWQPGNRLTLNEFLIRMTGNPLSADSLVHRVSQSPEQRMEFAKQALAENPDRRDETEIQLDATIEVVDGHEMICSTAQASFEEAATEFERAIRRRRESN